jgi:hypothetical protein
MLSTIYPVQDEKAHDDKLHVGKELPWMDMQQESINLTHTELGMC